MSKRLKYIIKPFGKIWTKVYVYDGNDLLKSYIVSASYNGGNIQEFIEKNKHIEQFCINYLNF